MLSSSARQSQIASGRTLSENKYIPQDVGVRQFRGEFLYDVRFALRPDELDFQQTDLFHSAIALFGGVWAYAIFSFDALIPTASFLIREECVNSLINLLDRPCDTFKIYKTRNGLAWYSRANVITWYGIQGAELPLFVEWMRLTTEYLNDIHDKGVDLVTLPRQQKLSFINFCHKLDLHEGMKHFKTLFATSIISGLWDVPPARVSADMWSFATQLECVPIRYRDQAKAMIGQQCRMLIPGIDDLTPEQAALRDRQREFSQIRMREAARLSDTCIRRGKSESEGKRSTTLAFHPALTEPSDSS
jgi:hypothetical protein